MLRIIDKCWLCKRETGSDPVEIVILRWGQLHPRIMAKVGFYNEQISLCRSCARSWRGALLRIVDVFGG